MSRINVAVLGCGFWGKNHARVLSESSVCNLVAVADMDSERARSIAEKYHVNWYTNVSEVLRKEDVGFVSICTPTTTHAQLAIEAIKASKHVLVEKPMTSTVKEAEKLIQAAKKNNVKLMVGFIERFNPAVQKAKEMIDAGEIGKIVLASSQRVSRWPERIGDVGVVKDLAIHDVDLISHIFGSEVEQVYAIAGSLVHKLEDYANIILSYKDGKNATIESNWLTPRKIRRLTVTGTEGIVQVEYITQEITLENQKGSYTPFFNQQEPLKIELEHFINSIQKGETPEPSGQNGITALRICEAALTSAHTHQPVKL
ncbi:Gfo/Idh/MocA family oxidoreductase [Candidatus Bathyarchaeota archaeon]|nr:Gfo/Idh/MocA family oxidoreductase [Candidatus Bathyarchaeota archaeon]